MEVVVGCSVGRGVEGGLAPRHDHGGAGDGGEVPAGGIRLGWGQVAGRVRRGSQPCNPGENHTSRPNHSKAAAHTKIWMLIQIIGKSQNGFGKKISVHIDRNGYWDKYDISDMYGKSW